MIPSLEEGSSDQDQELIALRKVVFYDTSVEETGSSTRRFPTEVGVNRFLSRKREILLLRCVNCQEPYSSNVF